MDKKKNFEHEIWEYLNPGEVEMKEDVQGRDEKNKERDE